MALVEATLSSALQAMTPTGSEATAIGRFADAWETYFLGATVSGAPLVPSSISAGLSALRAALVGMSAAGAGATSLAAGVNAFWTAQLAAATSMWVTAPIVLVPPIIAPPGLAGLGASLASVFSTNRPTLAAGCAALAAALHAASTGATVLGSVPPAPPAPIPIL